MDRRKPSLLVRMKIGAVNVKIVWRLLKKMKIRTIMWSSYSTSEYLTEENEDDVSKRQAHAHFTAAVLTIATPRYGSSLSVTS